LSRDLTFSDAAGLAAYLAILGVSDLYASPLMRARPGSTHGYGVVDPTALNPEFGTEEDYGRMVEALHTRGMGQLLDIVPNHTGVGSDNDRWLDVLKNGPSSPYAHFFDIDWCRRTELSGKVLLPLLGDHYRAVLKGSELRLSFDAEEVPSPSTITSTASRSTRRPTRWSSKGCHFTRKSGSSKAS